MPKHAHYTTCAFPGNADLHVPSCPSKVKEGGIGLCQKHSEFVAFLAWAGTRLQVRDSSDRPPALSVPAGVHLVKP